MKLSCLETLVEEERGKECALVISFVAACAGYSLVGEPFN